MLLTGGSSGIGAELLKALVARRCRVIVWSRRPPTIVSDLVEHEAVDLADTVALDAALDQLTANHPDLSVIINNSGTGEQGRFLTTDPKELDERADTQIAVNLTAPIHIANRLFKPLAEKPSAMIVNNTSGLAVAPTANNPIYCATKAGLRSFTLSMRYQAESHAPNLKIVEILLPVVATPMTTQYKTRKASVEKATQRIVKGLEKGEDEIWVGAAAVLRGVSAIAPGVARWVVKKLAK
ncbi:short-chain dehydrogenase/reductase SDR [Fulvimarina pelagi HTCC2506]|uniref:Short-chain dehydrogenase/reductase SDR n=1 Tax=Fulvimarina pelagi HTCC2506 TaxID=314231 RepID=Q0G1A3_9HYPH|nr:short-chain dehydrogenase/reductase SDR [Fulvimarina pelagi HTCC2506]